MILTNKTLEHFLEWKANNKNLSTIEVLDFKHLSVTIQNALIIEFFDSIEIIIQIHNVCDDWWFRVKSKTKTIKSEKYNEYKNRQQATIQAIEKANDLYNNTDKV